MAAVLQNTATYGWNSHTFKGAQNVQPGRCTNLWDSAKDSVITATWWGQTTPRRSEPQTTNFSFLAKAQPCTSGDAVPNKSGNLLRSHRPCISGSWRLWGTLKTGGPPMLLLTGPCESVSTSLMLLCKREWKDLAWLKHYFPDFVNQTQRHYRKHTEKCFLHPGKDVPTLHNIT